jgi:hypothetical protein
MCITNQNNGTRESLIRHDTSKTKACPVQALARWVHYIHSHPQCSPSDNISTYYSVASKHLCPLQTADINQIIKTAVRTLKLHEKGFPPEVVSSHSLCAGGAMAMHLNQIENDKIQKQDCWSFDTFLMYIHEEISALSAGLSAQMSKEIGLFFNIDGPSITRPGWA